MGRRITRRRLPKPKPCWNTQLMVADMARLGWDTAELARVGNKSYKTIDFFLRGERQTSKTAGAIAKALKQDVSRYLSGIEAVA